jgi:hypothetical protein
LRRVAPFRDAQRGKSGNDPGGDHDPAGVVRVAMSEQLIFWIMIAVAMCFSIVALVLVAVH